MSEEKLFSRPVFNVQVIHTDNLTVMDSRIRSIRVKEKTQDTDSTSWMQYHETITEAPGKFSGKSLTEILGSSVTDMVHRDSEENRISSDSPDSIPTPEIPPLPTPETMQPPYLGESGWIKLSGSIQIDVANPIQPGKKVYRGKQYHVGDKYRDVVAKILAKTERTKGEIAILLNLDHTNIVRVIETGDMNGQLPEIYIVMESCAMDLQEYTEKNEGFEFEKCFSYSKQLAEGVNYIHENNIVHRDLKPPNILISTCQKFIKVSDFGLSKGIPDSHSSAPVTNINDGTEGFKAPETYDDVKQYSYSADIFPLGLNIYFIFTNGKHPFGSNSVRRASNIMDNKNRQLCHIPDFPAPFACRHQLLLNALDGMLQYDPGKRLTAAEILKHGFFEDLPSRHPEEDKQRIKSIKGKLKKPLGEVGFENAAEMIDELQQLRGSQKFDDLLKLAECELHLNRGREKDSIRRLKNFISKSGTISLVEVRDKGVKFQQKYQYVRAVILYIISHDLHKKRNMTPDDELTWIKNRVVDMKYAVEPLSKTTGSSRKIAEVHGYPFMVKLLKELRGVNSDNKELRVRTEATCLVCLTPMASRFQKYKESIAFGECGVSIVETHFGPTVAASCKLYGRLLHNLGYAYSNSERYIEAERFLLQAIDIYSKCTEMKNESERKKEIDKIERSLVIARKNLEV